jgi:SHS2 domain-containing protein
VTDSRDTPVAPEIAPEVVSETPPEIAPGVRELDHTADVGIAVTASEPTELFRRAALGMARLMREEGGSGRSAERVVELPADSLDLLLVSWLAELLYLDEVEGFVFEDAAFVQLGDGGLKATVVGRIEAEIPERQLKGVTYHGLLLEPDAGGWQARVIFDI